MGGGGGLKGKLITPPEGEVSPLFLQLAVVRAIAIPLDRKILVGVSVFGKMLNSGFVK